MIKQTLQLKSGRWVRLKELNGSDSNKIWRVLGDDVPRNEIAASGLYANALAAFSLISFTVDHGEGHNQENMEPRETIKNTNDLDAFLSRFSLKEINELSKYAAELNSDDTPTSKEEVDELVKDVETEKK